MPKHVVVHYIVIKYTSCDTVVFDYVHFSKFHTHNGNDTLPRWNLKLEDHLGDVGIDGRVMLGSILWKRCVELLVWSWGPGCGSVAGSKISGKDVVLKLCRFTLIGGYVQYGTVNWTINLYWIRQNKTYKMWDYGRYQQTKKGTEQAGWK